jgi:hypothetical protein
MIIDQSTGSIDMSWPAKHIIFLRTIIQNEPVHIKKLFKRGKLFCNILYSTLFNLPALRSHCVGGCWD